MSTTPALWWFPLHPVSLRTPLSAELRPTTKDALSRHRLSASRLRTIRAIRNRPTSEQKEGTGGLLPRFRLRPMNRQYRLARTRVTIKERPTVPLIAYFRSSVACLVGHVLEM